MTILRRRLQSLLTTMGLGLWGLLPFLMINSTHAQYRTNGGGGDYQDDDYGSGAGGGASGYDRYGDDGSSAAGSYGMEPDTLYHDYAAHQQEKALRSDPANPLGGAAAGAGMGWSKFLVGGAMGWFVGAKFHTRRVTKKLQAKHKEEQKAVYQQYYNDVYLLQQQNAELIAALEQLGARIR